MPVLRQAHRYKILPIWKKYEFAALIAERRGDPNREVGELYLRGAWCCQLKKEEEEEKYCRRKAIEFFEKAFKDDEIGEEKAVYTYLVGELYRRIGDMENMVFWFDRVNEVAGKCEELKWLVDLAI